MSDRWQAVASVVFVTIILVVAGGVAPAAAAIGDIMSTINLKQANGTTDLCPPVNITNIGNNTTGTSVAIVQASKIGFFQPFFQPKVLLVTSCLGASTDATRKKTIHFINPSTFVDPTTNPPTSVPAGKSLFSITTSFEPPRGWSAIALRPDKGDFIACVATGSNTGNLEIYKISYGGSATPLVNSGNGALKGPLCDGLAWDYDTKTIYASKDAGTTIRRWVSATNNDVFAQVDSPSVPGSPDPDLTTPTQVPLGGGSAQSCLNSGLALVDGALFVACQGLSSGGTLASTGHLVNKNTGAVVSSLGTGTTGTSGQLFDQTLTEDIECDAVTFGETVPYRDALWAKQDRTSNVLKALELPAFTCGRSLGPIDPVTNNPLVTLRPDTTPSFRGPGACPVGYPTPDADTDGDGLLDCWEEGTTPGIDWDGDGFKDVVLCVDGVCADKNRKDIFVEVDSMDQHPFDSTARQQVIDAFANAPPTVINPNGTSGISLHILLDDGNAPGSDVIPHSNFVALEPCTPAAGTGDANLDQLKKAYFGTKAERSQGSKTLFAKRMAFRWALLAHDLKPPALNPGAKSSGCAKIGGDDLVVTLGNIYAGTVGGPTGITLPPHLNGNVNDQAGTFMHELGHTLGLRHGGPDNDNCKPNYLSAMSYTRQFSDGVPLTARRLDYSRGVLPLPATLLDEDLLDEALGIGTPVLPTGVTDETVFATDGPFVEPQATLTPAATSGKSITFTASAGVFAATDVGKILRGDGVPGEATIRNFLNATQVRADITVPFGSTSAIAIGSWRLVSRVVRIVAAGPNIDWNNDGFITTGSVADDVNNFAFPDSEVSGCDVSRGDTLVGWDDWSTLQYNHRAAVDVAAGGSNEVQDPAGGLKNLFENVDVNGDSKPDGTCPATGQPWVIDIQSPMKLAQIPGGDTQVKFFSQFGCIVALLDPSTLTLAGSSGIKGLVKLKNNGQFNCSTPDLNQDGLPDLVCHFDDAGFVIGDVVGVVEGSTSPVPGQGVGFRARGEVEVQ